MKHHFDCPLQSQKFQFLCWIAAVSFVHRLALMPDHIFFTINDLVKNHPQTSPTGISVEDEGLLQVCECQNGSGAAKVFDFVKGHLALISPWHWLVFLTCIIPQG